MSDSLIPNLPSERMIISPAPDSSYTADFNNPTSPQMPRLHIYDQSPRSDCKSLDFSEFADALSDISNENLLLNENLDLPLLRNPECPYINQDCRYITPEFNHSNASNVKLESDFQRRSVSNIKSEPDLPRYNHSNVNSEAKPPRSNVSNIKSESNPPHTNPSIVKSEPNLPDSTDSFAEDSKPIKISLIPESHRSKIEFPPLHPDIVSKLTPKNLKKYNNHVRLIQDIIKTTSKEPKEPKDVKNVKVNSSAPTNEVSNSKPKSVKARKNRQFNSNRNRFPDNKFHPSRSYPRNDRVYSQNSAPYNRFINPSSYSPSRVHSYNNTSSFQRPFTPFVPPHARGPMVPRYVLDHLNHTSQMFQNLSEHFEKFAYDFATLRTQLRG